MNRGQEALKQQLSQLAADFLNLASNRKSLITITSTGLSKKNDSVTFYVSVYPEEAKGPALGFLLRNRGECKEYIKRNSNMKNIPHVEFALDEGEKNRQRVDELLRE